MAPDFRGWIPMAIMVAVMLVWTPLAGAADSVQPGEMIYAQKCASCHGASGEGVASEHSRPLVGDMSRPQLADYVELWMPEEDPDLVVGEDAEDVAQYIFDAFYSPIAQARNRPAEIELSRLTVDQHRNAVADLVDSFRSPAALGEERGLRAQYFNARRPGPDQVEERREDEVNLHFVGGEEVAEGLEPTGFSARWRGSVIAPETGTYELIIHTDYAARLWLNTMDDPLIDAWVSSEGETEHRASVFLIGGRAYPLRLDFTSRDQGVNRDPDDDTPIEGFIELHWRQPNHAPQVIESRYLSPERSREVFVIDTSFPPEDRSVGYERGSSISKAWHRATTSAAIETAAYVSRNLADLAGDAEDAEALRNFALQFVERAFRRPLDDEQRERYIDRRFEEADDPAMAVRRIVLLSLMSPRFLYLDFRNEEPDSYEVASRLSFALWDSVPDRELREAAEGGQLTSHDDVRRQAERMVDDLRTRHKVRQFFHHWLHLEHNAEASKSSAYFPDFDERIVSDLRTSLNLFLDDVVWGEDPDFRRLMDANELFVNGRLAAYYGFDLPEDAPFQKIEGDHPQRRGVVSHPYVMAVFAYHNTTSPIHRGVILARGMFGRTLRPPPEAFTPAPPDEHPDMTTRERIAAQTEPASCMSCHSLINPLGFTLEQFDAVGRFREKEESNPVDASGGYELPSGETASFEDARDLAAYLADSEEAHQAFVLQLFHHMVKQPIRGYGQERPAEMAESFAAQDFHIRSLMAEIAATAALPDRRREQTADASDE